MTATIPNKENTSMTKTTISKAELKAALDQAEKDANAAFKAAHKAQQAAKQVQGLISSGGSLRTICEESTL